MAHKPTPEQSAIIEHIRDEPDTNTMIDARAGAAKTSTVEMASEHITEAHSPLAVAFNKKIADELVLRLPPHFTCKTLNGVGHGAWARARNRRLTVDADKLFKLVKATVPSDEGSKELFTEVLQLARKAKSRGLVPQGAPMGVKGFVPDHTDSWEDIGFELGFDVDAQSIDLARRVMLASIKEAYNGLIDFDDQIYMSVLFGGIYAKHHTVIVDESQDLSPMNHKQLQMMTQTRLIAVGDPYQGIYAFRGADSNSMTSLKAMMGGFGSPSIGKGKFKQLSLTKSFRVPKLISARQLSHVPDFGSMDWLADGTIESWPKDLGGEIIDPAKGVQQPTNWSLSSIPNSGFILCRNNAPLMKLAFALIKQKRPVKILGRDIGATLGNLIEKIGGKTPVSLEEMFPLVDAWTQKEITKAGDSESRIDTIRDRSESIYVLLEASEKPDHLAAAQFVRDLFSDRAGGQDLILSSIHRSKGLENKWVMHLDPGRLPSHFAIKAARHGNPGPLQQEQNLKYVCETRSMETLIEANLEDCLEIGE